MIAVVRSLVKGWKLVTVSMLLSGVVVYGSSRLLPPVYQSSALVQVSTLSYNHEAIPDVKDDSHFVQTEARLAMSDAVLREVASHYIGLTVEQLTVQVSVSVQTETQLFEITVQDNDPVRSATLANDIAATLIKQQVIVWQEHNTRLQQQVQFDLDTTHDQVTTLTSQIVALAQHKDTDPQLRVLQMQLNDLQQHSAEWQTLLSQLALAQVQNSTLLQIVQTAQPASSPVRPLLFLNTGFGLLFGLFLGAFVVVFRPHFDTRLRSMKALVELLELPVLMHILHTNTLAKNDLLSAKKNDFEAETYRTLRTNLSFSSIEKPVQMLAVTSAVAQEGKSTVATNLALSLAKSGKHTLLVDANLRHPTLQQKFAFSAKRPGLSSAVLAFARATLEHKDIDPTRDFDLDAYTCSTEFSCLRFMPSGPLPPYPLELVNSLAMTQIMQLLKSANFDAVILDLPPLLEGNEARLLTTKIEHTLLVVDTTCADSRLLKRAKTLLAQSSTHVVGCVLNKQKFVPESMLCPRRYSRQLVSRGSANKRGNDGTKISHDGGRSTTYF